MNINIMIRGCYLEICNWDEKKLTVYESRVFHFPAILRPSNRGQDIHQNHLI